MTEFKLSLLYQLHPIYQIEMFRHRDNIVYLGYLGVRIKNNMYFFQGPQVIFSSKLKERSY